MQTDIQTILRDVVRDIEADAAQIEAAADRKDEDATPGPIGVAIALLDGSVLTAGAATTGFPIQSISKLFALDLALEAVGDAVFDRVGREPSGDPFNSIIDLERTAGVPRNPFVNAGALVVVDILLENAAGDRGRDAVTRLVRDRSAPEPLSHDGEVIASEQEGGDLNRSMISFMRHHGNLNCDPDAVMAAYVKNCAITLDCRGLARAGLYLAATRRTPDDEAWDAVARRMRKVLALMMTCGHYDGSGDFAVRVGVPAKSGVGGGILAIIPEIGAIAVWSPNLDQHGNSILGVRTLEMIGHRTGWSVFGPPMV